MAYNSNIFSYTIVGFNQREKDYIIDVMEQMQTITVIEFKDSMKAPVGSIPFTITKAEDKNVARTIV